MKKRIFSIISAILLLSMVFTTAASAGVLRASQYFSSYSVGADANAGTGKVRISFSVVATGTSTKVGASSIVIQRKSGSTWSNVQTYNSTTTTSLMGSNSTAYANSVTYSGTSGYEYRANVTLYVQQSSGSESVSVTTNTVTTS
jgi:hypothetical protein